MAVDWVAARGALRVAVERVTDLLRSGCDGDAPAVGSWSAAEVAMHLSQGWVAVPGLARQDMSAIYEALPSAAEGPGDALVRNMADFAEMTQNGVKLDPERHLEVLADRIEARAFEFLREVEGMAPDDARHWLVAGATVTVETLVCHLLNETVVHGYDIARAVGADYAIEPSAAAMAVGGFLFPIIRALDPRALVNPERAARFQATYDVRVRGGDRVFFVIRDGGVRLEDPSPRPVDCHISCDPVALLLVMWGRKSQWSAIGRGQLMAWGNKPWLAPRLRSVMRNA